MKKVIEVDVDLTPSDISKYLINAVDIQQASILYQLSKAYYNKPYEFNTQLNSIKDNINQYYNHDIRNNIKNMVRTMYEYFCEVEDGNKNNR